jgi:hypothetical protein
VDVDARAERYDVIIIRIITLAFIVTRLGFRRRALCTKKNRTPVPLNCIPSPSFRDEKMMISKSETRTAL